MVSPVPIVVANMSDAGQIRAFHQAMLGIQRRIFNEIPLLGYTNGAFGMEIRKFGGLETAKMCLHSEELGAGFVALYRVNRLDLTLEALIHDNPEWHALFSEEELAICTVRLRKYGYSKIVDDDLSKQRAG